LKRKYEAELAKWRDELEDKDRDVVRARTDAERLLRDNQHIRDNLDEKINVVKGRDERIGDLEREIADLLAKNNVLINEKQRITENEQELMRDFNELKGELEAAKNELHEEKVGNGELRGKLEMLRKEMETKISILEHQLEAERRRNKLDFSNLDDKIRSEYAQRLRAELKALRKRYKEQTDKAKKEFMHVHSKRISELHEELSKERTECNAARSELDEVVNRINNYKDKIGELEGHNLQLQQKTQQLNNELEEHDSTNRARLGAKDREINQLHGDVTRARVDYETILEEKLALDTEIAVYKGLIEAEESRLARASKREAQEEERKNESSSDKEESGFFEKMKEKIEEAFD